MTKKSAKWAKKASVTLLIVMMLFTYSSPFYSYGLTDGNPASAGAQSEETIFTTEDNDDGTLTITGVKDRDKNFNLDIPAEINGKKVTAIGAQAFRKTSTQSYIKNIESVTFPEGLKAIENEAFQGNDLKTVTIPKSVTKIGESAFYGNKKLTSFEFAEGSQMKEIPRRCFGDCGIKSVEIPAQIEVIGESAFNRNPLKSVTLHDGIKEIGGQAFAFCELEEINLPSSIEKLNIKSNGKEDQGIVFRNAIGNGSSDNKFVKIYDASGKATVLNTRGVVNPVEVTINYVDGKGTKVKESEKAVGKKIKVIPEGGGSMVEGDSSYLTDYNDIYGHYSVHTNKSISEGIIGGNYFTQGKDYTFDAPEIEGFAKPESVTKSFDKKTGEITFTYTKAAQEDAKKAVKLLPEKENYTLEKGGKEDIAISGKTASDEAAELQLEIKSNSKDDVVKATLKDSKLTIEGLAPGKSVVTVEDKKSGLTKAINVEVTVPSIFTTEDNEDGTITITGFKDKNNPTDVEIPAEINGKKVTAIGDEAFTKKSFGSSNINNPIKKLKLPEGLEIIGDSAFQGSELTTVTIPKSVTTIKDSAFFGNKTMTSVEFAEGSKVKVLPRRSFQKCGFNSLEIPANVEVIGEDAFNGNPLKSVTLHENVKELGGQAFGLCELEEINFPASIEKLNAKAGGNQDNGVFFRNFLNRADNKLRFVKVYDKSGKGTALNTRAVVNPVEVTINYVDGDGNKVKEPEKAVGKKVNELVKGEGRTYNLVEGDGSYLTDYANESKAIDIYTNSNVTGKIIGENYFTQGKEYTFDAPEVEGFVKPESVTKSFDKKTGEITFTYTKAAQEDAKKAVKLLPEKENYTLEQGEKEDVAISGKTATDEAAELQLEIKSNSKNDVVKATLKDSKLTIEGLAPGKSVVTVEDKKSGLTKAINVEVTKPSIFTTKANEDGTITITGFKDKNNPDDVEIPAEINGKKVTAIGSHAFHLSSYGAPRFNNQIKTLKLPEGLEVVGDWAFQGNDLSTLTIPKSVTKLEERAFWGNEKLSTVNFEDGSKLKILGKDSLYKCALETIELPDSVEVIGDSALKENPLKSIKLPKNLKEIGDQAFALCSFEEFTIPATVEKIGPGSNGIFFRNFSDKAKKQLRFVKVYDKTGKATVANTKAVVNPVPVTVKYVDEHGVEIKTADKYTGKLIYGIVMVPGKYFEQAECHKIDGEYLTDYENKYSDKTDVYSKFSDKMIGENYFTEGREFTFEAPAIDGYEAPEAITKTIKSDDNEVKFVYKSAGKVIFKAEGEGVKADAENGEYGKGKKVNITITEPEGKELDKLVVNGKDVKLEAKFDGVNYKYSVALNENTTVKAEYKASEAKNTLEITTNNTKIKLGESVNFTVKYRGKDLDASKAPVTITVDGDDHAKFTKGAFTVKPMKAGDLTIKAVLKDNSAVAATQAVAVEAIDTFVTFADNSKVVLGRTPIKVDKLYFEKGTDYYVDVDFGKPVVVIAIKNALKGMGIDVADKNQFNCGDNAGWMQILGKDLWKYSTENGSFMYCKNNMFTNVVSEEPVEDGDSINVYYTPDWHKMEKYVFFDNESYKVKTGEKLEVTINTQKMNMDEIGGNNVSPVEGLHLEIIKDGKTVVTDAKTNKAGKIEHVFDKPGKYVLSAKSDKNDIIKPYATVEVEKVVDKAKLQAAVDAKAEVVKTVEYKNATKTNKDAYDAAVAEGQNVLNKANATQEEVDQAKAAIETAKTKLDGKVVDKAKLEAELAKAKALDDAEKYTAETLATLKTAIAKAEALVADENATQEAVDQAKAALTTAIEGLKEIPAPVVVDKTKLEAAVADKAEVEKTVKYKNATAAKKEAYDNAVAAGQAVLEKADPTQEEVDQAKEAIETAKAALDGTEAEDNEPTNPDTNLAGKWHKDNAGKWSYVGADGKLIKGKTAKINGNTYDFDKNGVMTTGWKYDKGTWYYFNEKGNGTEGAMAHNQWKKVGNNWYYFHEDGKMASNEMVDNGKYYVNKSGAWRTNKWVKTSAGKYWYYYKEGNYPKNEVAEINGNKYHFDIGGWMTTGWKYDKGTWYYFNEKGNGTEGAMAHNQWKKVGNNWYYFYKDGKMASDTMVGKYYVNKSGAWRTDKWVKTSSGKYWYYYKEGNYPKNRFVDINGNRYHFDNGGWMTTGWLKNNGTWYYFNKKGEGTEGAMVKNSWKKVNGKWYYFYGDGKMAKNTTVKGWKVNGSGAWVK